MRRDALMGLQGMEQNGQIEYVSGGKDKADKIDDNGGIVKAQAGTTLMGSANNRSTLGPGIGQPGIMPTAASQQYVRTPTTSGMMRQADTTPLVLDGKPYTPTTNLTNIYAPEQDYDAGGPEDCQEGYQYNYVTQKCEKIPDSVADPVVEQTQYRAPDVGDNDNNDQNPGGASTAFGGKRYNIGYGSSSIKDGFTGIAGGLLSTLSGGVDQVIFTDQDTGRTATMSKSGYDKMKEDRNNPNTRAYVENLMDIQEGLNKDYTNQKGFGAVGRKTGRPSGFLAALANPNARQFDQNNAAKALAKDMNIEYTGQSLAEMAVMSNARSSSPDVTPKSNTSATDNYSIDLTPIDDLGFRNKDITNERLNENSGFILGDTGYDPILDEAGGGFRNTVGDKLKNQLIESVNSGEATRTDLSRMAKGEEYERRRIGPDGQPIPGNEAMLEVNQYSDPVERRIEQQAAREALYDLSYDDLGMSTNEQMEAVGLGTNQRNLSAKQVRQTKEQTSAEDMAARNAALASQGKSTIVTNGNTGRPVRTNSGYLTSGGGAKLDRATVIAIGDAMNKEVDKKEAQEKQEKQEEQNVQDLVSEAGSKKASSPGDKSRAGEDSSGGGGGGKSIVCTEMYRQTQLDDWSKAMKVWYTYQKKYLTPTHEVGYHWLFKPYVRGMKNSGILTTVGAFFAQKRTQHLKHVLTKGRAKDSLVGNVWCKIIHPIVYLVGKIVYKK